MYLVVRLLLHICIYVVFVFVVVFMFQFALCNLILSRDNKKTKLTITKKNGNKLDRVSVLFSFFVFI